MIHKLWVTTILILAAVHFGTLIYFGISAEKDRIRQAWLDGYHHRQLESLPEIGIETHKEPAAGLLGKG